MKLIKVKPEHAMSKKKDALTKEQCLKEISAARVSMRKDMDRIDNAIRNLRVFDKKLADEKLSAFNTMTSGYFNLGKE